MMDANAQAQIAFLHNAVFTWERMCYNISVGIFGTEQENIIRIENFVGYLCNGTRTEENEMKHSNTHHMVLTALFIAMILLLGFTPMGLIPLGFINITIFILN